MNNYNYGVRHHKVTGSVLSAILNFTISNDESALKVIYEPLSNLSKDMKKTHIVDALKELRDNELSHMSDDMLNNIYKKAMKATKPVVFDTPTLVTESELESVSKEEGVSYSTTLRDIDERYIRMTNDEFIVGSKPKQLTLPLGFGGDKCPIKTCMVKEGYEFTTKRGKEAPRTIKVYERYLLGAEHIYTQYINKKREREKEGVSYSTTLRDIDENATVISIYMNFDSEIPWSIATIMGFNDKHTSAFIDFMVKYGFITKVENAVSYVKGYAKKHTAQYVVSDKYFWRRSNEYELTQPVVIDTRNRVKSKIISRCVDNELYQKTVSEIHRFHFPTVEYVEQVAAKMVADEAKNKHGKTYVFEIPSEYIIPEYTRTKKLISKKTGVEVDVTYTVSNAIKEGCPFVDITPSIEIYKRFLADGYRFINKGSDTRYYTTFTSLSKWIRELILIDGKPMIETDATSLHTRIIGKLLAEETGIEVEWLKGDCHTNIANILGIKRDEAKIINLSYWNSKIVEGFTISSKTNRPYFQKMDALIQGRYPEFWQWLESKKDINHRNMSKLLMAGERKIMDRVCEELNSEPYIYCFDCVYSTVDMKEQMNYIIETTEVGG